MFQTQWYPYGDTLCEKDQSDGEEERQADDEQDQEYTLVSSTHFDIYHENL